MQRGQLALVIGLGQPIEDEPVAQRAGEAHPHPRARHGDRVLRFGDCVVERPVQMTQGDIDSNPGDGSRSLLGRHTRS